MSEELLRYVIGSETLPLTNEAIARMWKRTYDKVVNTKRHLVLARAIEAMKNGATQ